MVYQPVPGVAQLTLDETVDGQRIFQTFYFASEGVWSSSELSDLCDAAAGVWHSDFAPLFPAAMTLNRVVATDLSALTGFRFVKSITPADPGTAVGDYSPLNATLAVHLDIGNRGRGKNGRTFWPCLLETNVTGDTASSAYGASIVAALEALATACEAVNTSTMCIVSRWENLAKRPTGQEFPIQSISLRDLSVDSQKLRLPAHKKHKKKKIVTPPA